MQPLELCKQRLQVTILLLFFGAFLFDIPPAHAFWPFSQPAEAPAPGKEELAILTDTLGRMAEQLTAPLGDDPSPTEGIVVCSFVELKKLTRTSSFGRYIAEHLMGEFQQRGHRVLELRKSTDILVQERRGEYGLSRNAEEIPGTIATGAMLTGTYTVTGDYILVNARLLDNRTTALLSSATAAIPKNRLTEHLLADRVSAGGPATDEVVYLKRFEM